MFFCYFLWSYLHFGLCFHCANTLSKSLPWIVALPNRFIRKGWGCYKTTNVYWVPNWNVVQGWIMLSLFLSYIYQTHYTYLIISFVFAMETILQHHNVWLVKNSKLSRKKIVSLVSHLILGKCVGFRKNTLPLPFKNIVEEE